MIIMSMVMMMTMILWATGRCNGDHLVTTPAMPWWSRLSHLVTAQSRRGQASYEIRMKRPGCVFSSNTNTNTTTSKYSWKGQVTFSPQVPKVVPCCCDRYERQGCIFVSRHYEFKISQTLFLLRISQTSKFRLTQWWEDVPQPWTVIFRTLACVQSPWGEDDSRKLEE